MHKCPPGRLGVPLLSKTPYNHHPAISQDLFQKPIMAFDLLFYQFLSDIGKISDCSIENRQELFNEGLISLFCLWRRKAKHLSRFNLKEILDDNLWKVGVIRKVLPVKANGGKLGRKSDNVYALKCFKKFPLAVFAHSPFTIVCPQKEALCSTGRVENLCIRRTDAKGNDDIC